MVSGDHVLGAISPIIAFWSDNDVNRLKDYFDSLELVAEYSTNLTLPGHGELIDDLKKRTEEIRAGHERRIQQNLEFVKTEAKTAAQVCNEIYGKLNVYKFFAPLMSTISRFVYLESIGKVYSELKNGKLYYREVD